MKKIFVILSLVIAIISVAVVVTPKANATTYCNGNPSIVLYHGFNYSNYWYGRYIGEPAIACAWKIPIINRWFYATPNVGEVWNDRIGSVKMFNWPKNSVIRFFSDENYGGVYITTTFNDGTTYEYIPNVYAFNTPWDEVSSIIGTSP